MKVAPNHVATNLMRAHVLSGLGDKLWELGPRSGVDIMEAAACFERAAAMSTAPAGKTETPSSRGCAATLYLAPSCNG